jgi:hypothetical protein
VSPASKRAETFGAAAPLKELRRKFGFEPARSSRRPWKCSGASEIGRDEAMVNRPDPSTNTKAVAKAETVAVAAPRAMVIFGAGGDLTERLIAPALYNLVTGKRLPNGFRGRRPRDQDYGFLNRGSAPWFWKGYVGGPVLSFNHSGTPTLTRCCATAS